MHKVKVRMKQNMKQRNFKNLNSDTFLLDIERYLSNRNVDHKFSNFFTVFMTAVNKHAPVKNVSKKQFKLSMKPWITPAIPKSMKKNNTCIIIILLKVIQSQEGTITYILILLIT